MAVDAVGYLPPGSARGVVAGVQDGLFELLERGLILADHVVRLFPREKRLAVVMLGA